MFEGDFRYFGEHAVITDELLFENGGTEGIFSTAYDVFFTSAIIGFLANEQSEVKGDRSESKNILSSKLISEQEKTNLIERTILLANEDIDLDGEEFNRINRALRNFTEDNIKKMNKDYIIAYAYRGIEILYDKIQRGRNENKDIVFIANELIDEYTSENHSYEGIHDLIMELSK